MYFFLRIYWYYSAINARVTALRILIYGINYSPELVGIGKYTGEMATWLSGQGHEIRVVTAPAYYPDWQVWPTFSAWTYIKSNELGVKVWRCPLFVPKQPTALKRILHLMSFTISSFPVLIMQLFWRPQILLLVAPTLFCGPPALLVAKVVRAKSILHIQDFEVDALFGIGLVLSSSKGFFLARLVRTFESAVLSAFDQVSTISQGMMQRALDKGVKSKRLVLFPNWSEVDRFCNVKRSNELLYRLGIEAYKKVILYSGNMGEKQGLELILQVAKKLKFNSNIIFLMVGEGASRSRLMQMAVDMELANVIFAPLQSYDELPILLASADVHLVIQRRGVADAVLPSKLTNILASGGNAVITADPMTTLEALGADNPGIAVIVEPESITALLDGILKALKMPIPNMVGITYAKTYLDKNKILRNFLDRLQR